MRDIYLYPNTIVLKNKLGIKNNDELRDAEADFVSFRLSCLQQEPLGGDYGPVHFLAFHNYIFQDLYEWAGEIRKINIYKEEDVLGGLSVEYSDIFDIRRDLATVLARMNGRNWASMTDTEKAQKFSEDIAALWKIHCFREGNTRTVITFCCQYSDEHGFSMERTLFEENSAYVRAALVAYNAVFDDLGDLSKPEYLEKIVYDSIKND